MSAILIELFKHNQWANLRLLDACEPLPTDTLNAAAPGTYGTAGDMLVHLLAAEGRYIDLLTGRRQEHPLRESDGFPGISELRGRARSNGESLIELAARVRSTRVLRGVYGGEP